MLAAGTYGIAVGDDETGLALRCAGWHVRDTCILLLPGAILTAYLVRRPLAGTVVENAIRHGVGTINVDRCRVRADETYLSNPNVGKGRGYAETLNHGIYRAGKGGVVAKPHAAGRWPTNMILVHARDCQVTPTPAECSATCPCVHLNEMGSVFQGGVGGISRFYPQFETLLAALSWLSGMASEPRSNHDPRTWRCVLPMACT